MPIFALGKWDLGHWDWELQTQSWEWETCLEITQHMYLMFSDIPRLIEQLKKYCRFRKSHKRNQRAASDNSLSFSEVFLILRVSYLVEQWLQAATEGAQITVRQPKKEKAVIKRAHDHNRKTAINRTAKG